MDLASYRKSRGISQQQCAKELGFRSKGSVSALETGAYQTSIARALQIEKWSGGEVAARELLPPEKAALLPDASEPARA